MDERQIQKRKEEIKIKFTFPHEGQKGEKTKGKKKNRKEGDV